METFGAGLFALKNLLIVMMQCYLEFMKTESSTKNFVQQLKMKFYSIE